jgi:hypothetical protein
LIPVKEEICPSYLFFPSLPPEDEVRKHKNYAYSPCPMDIEDPLLKVPFIHELLDPGPHLDNFWTEALPKKLKGRLEYTSGKRPIGWGIHIKEGYNWFALLSITLLLLLVTAIVVIPYAIIKDVASAVGVGQLVVSLLALVLTLNYHSWRSSKS